MAAWIATACGLAMMNNCRLAMTIRGRLAMTNNCGLAMTIRGGLELMIQHGHFFLPRQ